MDERKKLLAKLLDDRRVEIISIIDDGGTPLNDLSRPPTDAKAHLADHQIHRHDIEIMCIEVAENWPDVQSIECGAYGDKYPYIAIRIDPYDQNNAKRHDTLVANLRRQTPQYSTVSFYCLGEDRPHAVSAATQLYKRAG